MRGGAGYLIKMRGPPRSARLVSPYPDNALGGAAVIGRYWERLAGISVAAPEGWGGTVGPWPGEPPLGPLGPDVQEPPCGVPGTVGISGLADRILCSVQYPESPCERGAVRLVPSCARAGLAITTAQTASKNTGRSGRIADTEPARWFSILLHMCLLPARKHSCK